MFQNIQSIWLLILFSGISTMCTTQNPLSGETKYIECTESLLCLHHQGKAVVCTRSTMRTYNFM